MATPPRPNDTIAKLHRATDKALGIATSEMEHRFGKGALDQLAVATLAGTILNFAYGPAPNPEIRAALES